MTASHLGSHQILNSVVERRRERRRRDDATLSGRSTGGRAELVLVDDDSAARKHELRSAVDLHPLEDVEVHRLEVSLTRDRPQVVRVPDDDVGVGADLDPALPGVDPEGFGRIRTGDRDEPGRVGLLVVDEPLPDDPEPVFDAVDAGRNLGEVVPSDRLRFS